MRWRWSVSCFLVGVIAVSLGLRVDDVEWWMFVLSFDAILWLLWGRTEVSA